MLSGAGALSLLGLSLAGLIVDGAGVLFWFLLTGGVVILVRTVGLLIPRVMQLEEKRPASLSASGTKMIKTLCERAGFFKEFVASDSFAVFVHDF